jgi:TRAP-type C4-dicarboxylate transport system substrate-binding protein
VQKYLTLTGHVFSPCVFLMNLDLFNGLSPADQAHFVAAAQAGAVANRARVDEDEVTAIESMRALGMEIITDVDRGAFEAALAGFAASIEAELGSEDLQRIRDFQ